MPAVQNSGVKGQRQGPAQGQLLSQKRKKKNKERSICLHKDLNFHIPSSSYLFQLRPRKSSTVHCLIKLILKLWHAHVTGLGNKTEWSKNGLSSPKGLCTMTSLYKTKKTKYHKQKKPTAEKHWLAGAEVGGPSAGEQRGSSEITTCGCFRGGCTTRHSSKLTEFIA